jgi:hypothetical protein
MFMIMMMLAFAEDKLKRKMAKKNLMFAQELKK